LLSLSACISFYILRTTQPYFEQCPYSALDESFV
jgi:hypothetical protein